MDGNTPAPDQRWIQHTLKRGFDHLNRGEPREASECCRQLLSVQPDLVQAHFLVGLVALELRQTGHAIQAFGSVTKLKPDHGAAWANLARLYAQAGQSGRADTALAKAAEFSDDNPVVLDLIGTVYSRLGDHESAGRWNQKALDRQPDSIPFLVNQANNHLFFNRIDEAETLLNRVLERAPAHPNAHWLVSGLRKARNRDHVAILEKLVADPRQGDRGLAFLYYGLGKELEDLEEWDQAFAAFAAGARHRRNTLDYDEAAEAAMFEAFARTFTPEWLAAGPQGIDTVAPIFVVGQPRTGTTLVERVITAHSQVHSAGELQQFGQCLRRLGNWREPRNFSPALAEIGAAVDPVRLGEAYMATTVKFQGDTPRFVDKLPGNYLFLPLILKALPNAKIIHLRRGPMDACFASFKQLFADAYPHSYEQREMARHHARYYQLMDVWRSAFPGRFHDIAYEAIARDLEPNARALIDYLELPWEDACLEFHTQDTAVATASAVQVREPAHTRSIGRWRRYAAPLAPMQETLAAAGVPLEL